MFGRLRWQGKLAVLAGALLLANLIAAFVVMGRDDGSVHQIFLVEYSEPTQESDKQDQRQDLIVRRESDKPSGTLIDDPQGPVVSGQDDVVPGQADGAAKQQPDRGEDERFAGLVESWDHNRRIGSARSRTPTPAASASGVAGQRSQRNEPEATVDESSVGQTASAAGPDERSERQAVPEGGVADSPVRQPARPAPETELAAVESLVVLDKMPARGEPIAAPPVEPPRAPAKVFSPSAPQKSEDNTGASEELETASPGGAAEGGRTEVAKVADSPGKAATVATPAARIHGQPVQGREGAAKPSVPKRQKIAKLLASGHRSLQRDRLLVPSDDSAYKYYQEALILDPDNNEARLGIERVVARYAVLARKALDNDDETKGELYVNRGLSINPTDERLLGLRDSLKAPVVQVEPLLQPPVVPVKKPPSARVDEKEPEPTGFFSRLKAFFTQGQPAKRNEVPVEER